MKKNQETSTIMALEPVLSSVFDEWQSSYMPVYIWIDFDNSKNNWAVSNDKYNHSEQPRFVYKGNVPESDIIKLLG